jgi:glutaredoxin 3
MGDSLTGDDASPDAAGLGGDVVMFATRLCGYCRRARALLESKSVSYREIFVDADPAERFRMERLAGRRTVPQIFIRGRHVGGCDQLYALERAGQLDALLFAAGTGETKPAAVARPRGADD